MTKTELSSLDIFFFDLFHHFNLVGPNASEQLSDTFIVGGSNSGLIKDSETGIKYCVTYSWPIFGSVIPNRNFYFFELLVDGRWLCRKVFRVFVTLFWVIAMMFSNASSAVVKGW